MSDRAKELLEELERHWPEEMDAQRYIAIQTALTLLDKGITYSQPQRHAMNKETGYPKSMDCSSFVTYCLIAAGQKIKGTDKDAAAYTGTYLGSNLYTWIKPKDLIPGDVALYSTSYSGGNHIGMYIGQGDDGKQIWIEVTGGGVVVFHKNKHWAAYLRYNQYDENYQYNV